MTSPAESRIVPSGIRAHVPCAAAAEVEPSAPSSSAAAVQWEAESIVASSYRVQATFFQEPGERQRAPPTNGVLRHSAFSLPREGASVILGSGGGAMRAQ